MENVNLKNEGNNANTLLSPVFCPECEKKVKLISDLNTDWYGNLKYYRCRNCKKHLSVKMVVNLKSPLVKISGMLLPELEKELEKQQYIYTTERDLFKANLANWYMTIILIEIKKLKQLSNYR